FLRFAEDIPKLPLALLVLIGFLPADRVEALAVEVPLAGRDVALFPAAQAAVVFDQGVERDAARGVLGLALAVENLPESLRANNILFLLRPLCRCGKAFAAFAEFEVKTLPALVGDELDPRIVARCLEHLPGGRKRDPPAVPLGHFDL